jgi:hypothetical protein
VLLILSTVFFQRKKWIGFKLKITVGVKVCSSPLPVPFAWHPWIDIIQIKCQKKKICPLRAVPHIIYSSYTGLPKIHHKRVLNFNGVHKKVATRHSFLFVKYTYGKIVIPINLLWVGGRRENNLIKLTSSARRKNIKGLSHI